MNFNVKLVNYERKGKKIIKVMLLDIKINIIGSVMSEEKVIQNKKWTNLIRLKWHKKTLF